MSMEIIGNRELTYLYAGGAPFAIHEKNGNDEQLYYLHLDYQGSIRAITDEQGTVVEERDYDAWGRPRDPYTLAYTATNPFSVSTITNRGYTFHEHIFEFSLINMNARMYDPVLRRVISPDNYIQAPDYTQSFNRYSYCWNNPLKYTDPDGNIIFTAAVLIAAPFTGGASLALLPYAIGADVGMWQGGSMANGTMNPTKWDYSSGKTWGYMAGGAVVGAASGGAASAVATSGMVGANTAAIVTGSFINSVGTHIYTGGKTDVTVGFGFGSYNFSTGEFGYLGKRGNSAMENIGYGLGSLANVADILAGSNPGNIQLNTEKSDAISHSALTKVGETSKKNSYVSVGPAPGGKWIFNPFKFKQGTNKWNNYVDAGNDVWKVTVDGINLERIAKYGANLNKGVKYNLYFSSCVNHTARALTLAGAPSIGIHPFILHSQMVLRSVGFRPMLYSYHLYQY